MEHAEALELIELAAVEPDGLERLMAGDTPESGAVAGHLAGCPACVAELARIRRTAILARRAIATAPDPELRVRTLAFVREVGRDRTAEGAATAAAEGAGAATVVATPGAGILGSPNAEPVGSAVLAGRARPDASGRRWLRLGLLAAGLALAVGLGFGAGSLRSQEQRLGYEIAVLEDAAAATVRLEALPDTRRVVLAATEAGGGATGQLLFSPSTGELLMVATGLAPLPDGQEYGCWMEVDGSRTRIGRMYRGGSIEAWAGPVDGLAELPDGAVFGVSLVRVDGGASEAVLTGS